jgi:hypothetical protein
MITAWDLVLRARARPHELAALRESPTHRSRVLVGHPHRVQLAGSEQLGQRPRIEPVGLRSGATNRGVVRADDDDVGDMRADDPRDLRRVAGDLERYPIRRSKAASKQLKRRGRRQHPARRRDPPVIGDRDLAEVTVNVHPHRPEHVDLLSSLTKREQEGNTTQTDPRSQRNRASRRGGQ